MGRWKAASNQNPRASWSKTKLMRLRCGSACCGQRPQGTAWVMALPGTCDNRTHQTGLQTEIMRIWLAWSLRGHRPPVPLPLLFWEADDPGWLEVGGHGEFVKEPSHLRLSCGSRSGSQSPHLLPPRLVLLNSRHHHLNPVPFSAWLFRWGWRWDLPKDHELMTRKPERDGCGIEF